MSICTFLNNFVTNNKILLPNMEDTALILYTVGDIFSYLINFHTVQHKKRQLLVTLSKVNKTIKKISKIN